MGESTTAKIVRETTGMWWPDADSGGLRQAADAWRAMAEAVDDVTAPANQAAQRVVSGNHGPAIDAFHAFWNRYYDAGSGALPDVAHACRQMAQALDRFADEVDKAVHRLEEEAAIVGATLVAGTALAVFTAGISEAAAGAATAGIIAAADALGVAVSETVATIAATTLTGAAFGAVESVAVDALVAQPVRIAFGDGGFSGTELLSTAETGGLAGGLAGGFGAGARSVANAAESAENASAALTALGKVSTGLDTLPGRMATGAALGAGQDALLNGGTVNPLDVATGAIGGAAGLRRRAPMEPGGSTTKQGGYTGATAEGRPGLGGYDAGDGFIYAEKPDGRSHEIYQKYRGMTDDVQKVADHIDVDPRVVQVAKENLMINKHDVPVGPGDEVIKGIHFTPDEQVATFWDKAYKGTLKGSDVDYLRGTMAHEYVEAKLMEAGMPYLSPHPDAWSPEGPARSWEHFGAHNIAPASFHPGRVSTEPSGSLKLWRFYGLEGPSVPIERDLSNLDEVVRAAKEGLGL
ncbi:WXG100 family type VII secretion target [Streptomyces sp. NPDC001380]|uniref:WXG100 family type VII secretion target n=1 Tax=Streptomyces sp. NPDC001380 TaxID=3364566 RepID=UPI0036B62E09